MCTSRKSYLLACGLKRCLDFSHRREDRTYGLPERPFFGKEKIEFGRGKNFEEDVQYALRHQFHPETEMTARRSGDDDAMEAARRDRIDELDRIHLERLRQVFQSRTSDWEQPLEYWTAQIDDVAAEADDYVKRWNALMTRLRTYEQLYIAA